uniref:ATP-dependent Clp protease proteolytic subunit n=1 Tax=Passiflora tenuiloba TaxID=298527 RepID=A0A4Y5QED6_9ROSI|nr:clp protease proteolytic subunit [Passiflora tenuiloba]YP_009670772.1 clp protease proteolytic subunit [Passiflora tenuiloba]QCX30005.1 clp protease proteolytic subunit [Passiflora tenuiloba]QCX30006.1 clp protease proteolytic subunit [Passiflora tenuiloba]
MPIGIPLVPIVIPPAYPPDYPWLDDDDTDNDNVFWVNIYDVLYQHKFLFLCKDIENDIENQLVALFLYLNAYDTWTDFTLFINSPGGSVLSGMTIFNAMELVTADVATICVGIAASMASFLLAAGSSFKRYAFPHATVMIHQPYADFSEENYNQKDPQKDPPKRLWHKDANRLFSEMDELMVIQETIANIYAKKTGQPLETILTDLERDFYMSATEAKDYGIIDYVARNRKSYKS